MPGLRRATLLAAVLVDAVILAAAFAAVPHHDDLSLERGPELTQAARADVGALAVPAGAQATVAGPTLTLPGAPQSLSAPGPVIAPFPPGVPGGGAPASRQDAGAAALALIRYPWRDLGATITFLPARAGLLGKTFPDRSRIEIYVRPGESTLQLAYTAAHEIGHMVDWRYGTPQRRALWEQLRGVRAGTPWFGSALGGGDDLGTPAGDFAETFALWQIGPVDYKSRVAPPPTADQMARLAPLFAR